MGKIDAESSIAHFSHPHPLKLLSHQPSNTNRSITCSICTKEAGGLLYVCEACSNFCLHKTCSNMPEKLNHKADQKHGLTLCPYPQGSFRCNACGVLGNGFCYSCKECGINLHTVCAFMRLSVQSMAHHHTLEISYGPPYEDKSFICDICEGSGSDHWLYRCELCEFDAHLKCARTPNCVQVQPKTTISKLDQNKPHSSPRIKKIQQPQIQKSTSVQNCPRLSFSQTENCFQPIVGQSAHVGIPFATETYPFGAQSSRQLHRYETSPLSLFPMPNVAVQHQPTRNDAVQQMVQSVVEGLIEGAASQLGQALFQAALNN